MYMMQYAQSR